MSEPTLASPGITADAVQSIADRRRMQLQHQIYDEETDCWWCGNPVDLAIQGSTHPWGPVVTRIRPAWVGGDSLARDNSHLAHRTCHGAHCRQLRAGQ